MLIDWADKHVKMEDLINAALRYAPGNLALMRQAVALGISSAEELARSTRERAATAVDAGQLDEARRLLEQALALSYDFPNRRPLEEAACLRDLAHVLDLLGKVREARTLLERAVALLSAELGTEDQQTREYEAALARLQVKAPPGRAEKFTELALKTLQLAQEEAQRFNHNYIGTEHILLGLVGEGDGVAARVLNNLGIELTKVRSAVEFIIGRGNRMVMKEISLTPRAKRVHRVGGGRSEKAEPPLHRHRAPAVGAGAGRRRDSGRPVGEPGRTSCEDPRPGDRRAQVVQQDTLRGRAWHRPDGAGGGRQAWTLGWSRE